jgi:hypothetical protein
VVLGSIVVVAVAAAALGWTLKPNPAADPRRSPTPAVSASTPTNHAPATEHAVSYDAFYLPFNVTEAKIRSDLTYIKGQNVTAIYVSCNEADIANPAKLNKIVKVGRELGLRLYINPYIGGTFSADEGVSSKYYLDQHPQSDQISRRGLKTGRMPSVNDPAYRAYLRQQIAALAAFDFDGIQYDEPEAGDRAGLLNSALAGVDYYPYDPFSQKLFKDQYGYDLPLFENQDTIAFRRASVLSFVKELIDYTRQIRPGWVIGLVLLPNFNDGDIAGTDNWKDYASLTNLDVFMIDPYWYPDVDRGWDWFQSNVGAFLTATHGSPVRTGIWVRAFGLTGDYSDITQSLQFAAQHTGWQAVWVTDNWPSADPVAMWAAIKAGFAS